MIENIIIISDLDIVNQTKVLTLSSMLVVEN